MNYISKQKGNIPIIISVPHGGALVPQNIPNRDFGSYKKDKDTQLVLKAINDSFAAKKLKPYYVCMNLHRRKIDVNRGSKEGAQDKEMLKVYKSYHKTLQEMRAEIQKKFGGGFLVDMHGQSFRKGFVEIGYSVPMEKLNDITKTSDAYLKKHAAFSSLLSRGHKKEEIVFGKTSFGTILSGYGYRVMPSAKYRNIDERHFNGVYILHRHVVARDENISGINLELCYDGLRNTVKNREKFARAFRETTLKYLKKYYNWP